jgi:antitoxin component of MazEF toxin-antitoxin module
MNNIKFEIGQIVEVVLTGKKVQIVATLPKERFRVATADEGYRIYEKVELMHEALENFRIYPKDVDKNNRGKF